MNGGPADLICMPASIFKTIWTPAPKVLQNLPVLHTVDADVQKPFTDSSVLVIWGTARPIDTAIPVSISSAVKPFYFINEKGYFARFFEFHCMPKTLHVTTG